MWRMTPRLAIATLTATLASAALPAPEAGAAAIQSYGYSTDARLGEAGAAPVTLSGVYGYGNGGPTLTTPGSFVLGEFQVYSVPSTVTVTYDHTPFTIDLTVSNRSDGYYYGPGDSSSYTYRIQGEVNGSFTSTSSSLMATVTSITGNPYNNSTVAPPFPIEDIHVSLPQGIAGPNGYNYGRTQLIGQVLTTGNPLPPSAPEPTSVAAFVVALAGWGLRRRLRRAA